MSFVKTCYPLSTANIITYFSIYNCNIFKANILKRTTNYIFISKQSPHLGVSKETIQDGEVLFYLYQGLIQRHLKPTSSNGLLINFPSVHNNHTGVSNETISRCRSLIISISGFDTKIFKAHSTGAASCAAAAQIIEICHVFKPQVGIGKLLFQYSIENLLLI